MRCAWCTSCQGQGCQAGSAVGGIVWVVRCCAVGAAGCRRAQAQGRGHGDARIRSLSGLSGLQRCRLIGQRRSASPAKEPTTASLSHGPRLHHHVARWRPAMALRGYLCGTLRPASSLRVVTSPRSTSTSVHQLPPPTTSAHHASRVVHACVSCSRLSRNTTDFPGSTTRST